MLASHEHLKGSVPVGGLHGTLAPAARSVEDVTCGFVPVDPVPDN